MHLYYFGCYPVFNLYGHYLYDAAGRSQPALATPWGYDLDGVLLMPTNRVTQVQQREGHGVLVQLDGWTAFSFWDRSGDSRLNSNSAFVADALLSHEELLKAALDTFPTLFRRFSFPLVLAQPLPLGQRQLGWFG